MASHPFDPTSGHRPGPSRRRRRSSAHPTPHRAVRARALAASLAKGAPVSTDAVDLVIAAGEHLTGRPPQAWTLDDVEELAWFGLLDHAHRVGASLDGLAPAALAVLIAVDPAGERGLADTLAGLLDTGSTPPARDTGPLQPA